MVEILRRLWKENEGKIKLFVSASVYADDATIVLVKQRVWRRGPIYIDDSPFARFPLNDLSNIQTFLVEILLTPIKEATGDLPAQDTKEYLKRLGVRSVRQSVERYKNVSVRLIEDSLVASPSTRDYNSKAWIPKPGDITEKAWGQDSHGAKAVLEALRISE